MAGKTLAEIADTIRDIDFCQFATKTDNGQIAARPMSNNTQVDYNGDHWFFSKDTSRTCSDIQRDPAVTLTYHGSAGVLGVVGKPGPMVVIQGSAEVVRDKEVFRAHWVPELEFWFENGIDDPQMVMFRVRASRINFWDGMETEEIEVTQRR